MKISQLMEHHQKYQKQGLPESLGDGYLMVHNAVYRNLRNAALKEGFRFSNERNEAYESFPLLQLETLLQSKVIPYSNNIAGFELLTSEQLSLLDWEDIEGNLKKNFVFHEASHAVVRSLALKTLGSLNQSGGIELERKRVLRMLLEESCSNTCELFGGVAARDQVHRIFYEMNSYICEFEHRTNLKNAMEDMGSEVVVKFLLLSYLQSNFLVPSIDDREFQEMVSLATSKKLNSKQLKTLRGISKIAFYLSERFRVQTTSFHLRLSGIKTSPNELFRFNFLNKLKQQEGFDTFLDKFASVICLT